MSNYRRYRVEGATYFFTLVADGREPFLCHDDSRKILRRVMLECKNRWQYTTDAIVLLPDHLHAYGAYRPTIQIIRGGGPGSKKSSQRLGWR